MNKSQKKKFIISYEEEKTEDLHSMNIEDLAPALISLDKIFQNTNTLLNGHNSSNTCLKIMTTQKGSFEIVLFLTQFLPETLLLLEQYNSKKLLDIVFGEKGLFTLIKELSKNFVNSKSTINNNYSAEVINIFQNSNIKKETKIFINPIKNAKKSKVKVLSENKELIQSINTQEAREMYEFLEQETEKETEKDKIVYEKYYHIIKLNFEKEKWTLSDSGSTLTVLIEDSKFLQEVKTSLLRFSKDDILKCRVREEQKEINGKLKSHYFIEEVLEHKPASKQMTLFSHINPK